MIFYDFSLIVSLKFFLLFLSTVYSIGKLFILTLSARWRLYTSESDVSRRQILTYKDDRRAERIKFFQMAVEPFHRFSNEADRANSVIYDDFKLKKNLWSPWFIHNSALSWLKETITAFCLK